jgi:hypothetical protein
MPYPLQDLRLKKIALFIQVLGILAVFVGLVMNSKAINNSATATKNSTLSSLSAWSLELNKQFVQYPDMRPYFNEGKDLDEKDPRYERAMALAAMHADLIDSMFSTEGFPPHDGWNLWTKTLLQRSPILSRYLRENKQYYPILWAKVQSWENEQKVGK